MQFSDDQESVWGICLDVLDDIQQLLNFLNHSDKDTASSSSNKLHPNHGFWEKPVPPTDMEEAMVLFWYDCFQSMST